MSWRSLPRSMRLWLLAWPSYWRARDRARRTWFMFRLARYGIWRRGSTTITELGVSARLIRQLLPMLILATIAVVVVDWLASLLSATFPTSPLVESLVSRPDSAAYTGFLIATAAFGATLLALFFTALSVVVSTGYSRAPVEVRSLLLNEQAGAAYTKAVGLLVAVSLLVLAVDFIGYRPPALTLAGIAVFGSVSVLALLVLGPRAFSYFDVAALGLPLRRQFREWSLRAAKGNADGAFERHFQQQASDVLDVYPMLIGSAEGAGEVAADPIERLGSELVRLWGGYAGTKTRISPNSFWFERQAAHRDWLTSTDLALQPALSTGTALPAEEVPDRLWVERRVSRVLDTIYAALLSMGRGQGAYRLALTLSELTQGLASAFQFDAAAISLGVLTRQRPMLVSSDPTRLPATLDRQLRYAVLDAQALAVVGLVLGLRRASEYLSAPDLWADVDRALGSGAKQASPHLSVMLDYIEVLRTPLAFEKRVEGSPQTPEWFLRQMVARKLFALVTDALDEVASAIEQELLQAADDAEDVLASALMATRALEAVDKLETHLPTASAALNHFESIRRSLDEYWPARDDAALQARVQALRDRCYDGLGRLLVTMPGSVDPTIPDYFGQAYSSLVAESFNLLQTGRHDRFSALYPAVFVGGWRAFERIRGSLGSQVDDPRRQIVQVSGPVIDLLELSGYALLERELGNDGPWTSCTAAWNAYFAGVADAADAAQQIVTLVDRRDLPALLPGDLIRTGRVQVFHRRLSQVLGADDDWDLGFEARPRHASPIIRVAARMTFSQNDVVATFLNEAIVPRLPEGADLPRAVTRIAESIALSARSGATEDEADEHDVIN